MIIIFFVLSSPLFGQNLVQVEKHLLNIVDKERNIRGLSSFVTDSLINNSAAIQADYLSEINSIKNVSHTNPIVRYRNASDRVKIASNSKYAIANENITAFFYDSSKTDCEIAEQIHSNFMESKYHRMNILSEVRNDSTIYPSYYGHCVTYNKKMNYIIAVQVFPDLNYD